MSKDFCLLIVLALATGASLAEDRAAGKSEHRFRTEAVRRGSVVQTIQGTGTLQPEEVIDVGAQVAGMIQKLGTDPADPRKTVDFGTHVEAGTILAQIDASLYQGYVQRAKAQVRLAEAGLKRKKAQLALAQRAWNKGRKLLAGGGVAREDVDDLADNYEAAKAEVDEGEAKVALANAALERAETNLRYTTIRSPIAGVIIDRRVNVGQTVVASLTAPSLFLIAKDLKRLQVWASVNEKDIAQIKPGQRVRITVSAHPNDVLAGKVTQVRLNAAMTQNVVTYTVVVETDNPDSKLLPYLTANLSFLVGERKDVLLVPNAALHWRPQVAQVAPAHRKAFLEAVRSERAEPARREDHQSGVVWVEDKGFVQPVKLRLGLSDGTVTEIVEGDLREGVAVVLGVTPGEPPNEVRKEPRRHGDAHVDRVLDCLLIMPGATSGGGVVFGEKNVRTLTVQDADAIARDCPAVVAVAPIVRIRQQVTHDKRSWVPLYLYGTTPAYLKARGWDELPEGHPFTEKDVRARKRVCLVGQTLVKELFEGQSPVGNEVRIRGLSFKVLGVLPRAGTNAFGLDKDDLWLAPWTAVKDLLSAPPPAEHGKAANTLTDLYPGASAPEPPAAPRREPSPTVDQIVVCPISRRQAAEAMEQITALLRERHRLRKGKPDDFEIRDEAELRKAIEDVSGTKRGNTRAP
jgi:HlyD family secretion protein